MGVVAAALSGALVTACGDSLPRPPATVIDAETYGAVPFPPRTPPVEFIPPSPVSDAVWIDGSWEWRGGRYVWRGGTWLIPPPGAHYAKWTLVRRESDGQLFFAPSAWRDASGQRIVDRSFVRALGGRARARNRAGAQARPERDRERAQRDSFQGEAIVDTGEED